MAHWDEERDKRWVAMLRECETHHPEVKALTDAFERTGETVYWSAALDMLRRVWHKKDLEERQRERS